MPRFEYKVVAAPQRGQKAKGVKRPGERFALAMETALNELASQGWEYVRADTLPSEERQGLRGKQTEYQNVLVFRREMVAKPSPAPAPAPLALIEDHASEDGTSDEDEADNAGVAETESEVETSEAAEDSEDSTDVADKEIASPSIPSLGGFRREKKQ